MQTQRNDPSSSPIESLRRMADEIRVKIHLAGMEAKDAWKELEPKLRELERKAEAVTDDVANELKERMSKLLARIEGR